jgi:hypothetical protein
VSTLARVVEQDEDAADSPTAPLNENGSAPAPAE